MGVTSAIERIAPLSGLQGRQYHNIDALRNANARFFQVLISAMTKKLRTSVVPESCFCFLSFWLFIVFGIKRSVVFSRRMRSDRERRKVHSFNLLVFSLTPPTRINCCCVMSLFLLSKRVLECGFRKANVQQRRRVVLQVRRSRSKLKVG